MSTKTIEFRFDIGGTLTDVTSVVLRDPSATYGVRRADTFSIVVAAGTALTHVTTGVYRYTFTEPATGLNYNYWLEWVYLGNTRRQEGTLQTAQASGVGGSIPIPPSEYVSVGVETVSCGDSELAEFLTTHANLLWAIQLRRGTTLDLRYQYFVLELIHLALDHVRMLIDTQVDSGQMQETGYNNASNVSDSEMNATRSSSASSTQSASAIQSSTRSALRTSSSAMIANASQHSERNADASDVSTQEQTSDTNRTADNDSQTKTTPYLHATNRQYKNSHMESSADSYVADNFIRYEMSVPFVGSLSGHSGTKDIPQTGNLSTIQLHSEDSAEGHSTRRNKVVGDGLATDDATTEADGARTNNVARNMLSTMTGSAVTTSSSSMSSTAHAEAHRTSESSFHSESSSHAEMTASATAHRESLGASQMVSSGSLDKQYYDQIFASLQQMWKDTLEQIKQLEKQVQMTTRVIIRRLPTLTPQATLTRSNAFGNNYIVSNPFGTPFDRSVR